MPTSTVRQDEDDLFDWSTIITSFEDSGALASRFIYYDDGRTRSEDYDEGIIRNIELRDFGTETTPNGTQSWEKIVIDYDENGVITDKYQLNDNGIQILTNYDAGVISLKIETDYAPGDHVEDAAIWDTRWTYYDENGQVEAFEERRDDGVEIFTRYENGVRRSIEQVDLSETGDARRWERNETYFDESGQIEAKFELRDDGVEIVTQYENGVRRSIEKVDLSPTGEPSDARVWERHETYFDESGQIEAKFELRDDGVEIVTQYENGVRRSIEQVDLGPTGEPSDARKWERNETYFDENGQVEAKYELWDSGVEVVTQYENGVRRSVEQTDFSATGGTSDAEIWERIDTYYDEEGQTQFRFEQRDNGVTIETEYENGQRVQTLMTDGDRDGAPHDTEEWDMIGLFYGADGKLQARETIYDNGDLTAFLFEDGNRTARYDLDGDGSESWETREILYNADGTVAEINYDVAPDMIGY